MLSKKEEEKLPKITKKIGKNRNKYYATSKFSVIMSNFVLAGIMGLCVADALGVPV